MAGSSSLEAVRRKIRSLQEQADAAEERAGSLQRELDQERKLRETVRDPPITPRPPHAAPGAPRPTGFGLLSPLPVYLPGLKENLQRRARMLLRRFWERRFSCEGTAFLERL